MLYCKHDKAADNHTVCPPQHDPDNAACPHVTDPSAVCTCEVEDNLGWILRWDRAKRTSWGYHEEQNQVMHPGKVWSDKEDNYSIFQADGTQQFRIVCEDGTPIATVGSLKEAKRIAQQEYAGISIAFYGSREEYDREHCFNGTTAKQIAFSAGYNLELNRSLTPADALWTALTLYQVEPKHYTQEQYDAWLKATEAKQLELEEDDRIIAAAKAAYGLVRYYVHHEERGIRLFDSDTRRNYLVSKTDTGYGFEYMPDLD